MRMWMVPPRIMCRQHLLGEHFEVHCIAGMVREKMNLDTPKWHRLIEVHNLPSRHEELVQEMVGRGMHHNSPFPDMKLCHCGDIPRRSVMDELLHRCFRCYCGHRAADRYELSYSSDWKEEWERLTFMPEYGWFEKRRISV